MDLEKQLKIEYLKGLIKGYQDCLTLANGIYLPSIEKRLLKYKDQLKALTENNS